ncbi:threonine synthase [Mycobacterium xenopi 3993]|nr:threonine synthase [Mycobacterium xenopi 3993]
MTLLEGGTPLIYAAKLSAQTGCTVHLKVEGLNPTGSFKDRGMTMAVTDAVARGQQAVLCASTGNTSASAAAYAAAQASPARCWCRRAKSRWASWRRLLCTAPRSSRSTVTSTTAWNWRAKWQPISRRSRWSTPSTRCVSKARKRRPSRSSMFWATRQTCTPCR